MKLFIVLTAIGENNTESKILINTRKIRHAPAYGKDGGAIVIQDDDVSVEVKETPEEIEQIIIYGSLERAKEVQRLNERRD